MFKGSFWNGVKSKEYLKNNYGKNNFYSLLSLNKIRKRFDFDKSKILKYFDKLETSATTRDNKI